MRKTTFRISRASTASSTATKRGKPSRILSGEMEMPLWILAECPVVIAVDPGLQGTGVAAFERGELTSAWVIQGQRDTDWLNRATGIATSLKDVVDSQTVVVSEMMEFQGQGARGLGWRTGDMQKTTFFTGALMGMVWPCPFLMVPVHRWKGQLPKGIVQERLTRIIGAAKCKKLGIHTHAWDAVGIGLWAMGRF